MPYTFIGFLPPFVRCVDCCGRVKLCTSRVSGTSFVVLPVLFACIPLFFSGLCRCDLVHTYVFNGLKSLDLSATPWTLRHIDVKCAVSPSPPISVVVVFGVKVSLRQTDNQ